MDTGFQVPGMNEIEQLELVRSLGFAGVTWSLGDPERLRRVGEHAERIGLRLIAVYTVAQLKRDALVPDPRVDGVLAAMRGLAPRLWLAIQSSDFARSSEAGDEPAVDGLRRLADRAAAAGVTISLYHHSGYWMERIEHAVRLARKTARPNVVVTFNLAHWLKTDGRNLAEHLDEAMPLLDSVTINGATVTNDTSWANLIQPLHRGTFDWAAVVRELDRRGFRGPICLQLWGIGGLKQDNLRNSIAAWRAAFP
ncbi:MAG: sugar phosphate isomerase/epimerase [Kiritimatiellae bacterium]|nr:sugar phosphate isomerase/epimerase [Kiritimatiellia bacterium]